MRSRSEFPRRVIHPAVAMVAILLVCSARMLVRHATHISLVLPGNPKLSGQMKQDSVRPLKNKGHSAHHAPKNRPKNGSALLTIAPATRARVMTNYGKLPLSFEPNEGQTDSEVQFLSRGNGYTVFLEANEAALALRDVVPGFGPASRNTTLSSAVATQRGGATEGCRPFDSLRAAHERGAPPANRLRDSSTPTFRHRQPNSYRKDTAATRPRPRPKRPCFASSC